MIQAGNLKFRHVAIHPADDLIVIFRSDLRIVHIPAGKFLCQDFVSYWHYGFGHFLIYADFIQRFTASKPDPADRIDYFTSPKVKAIATFMQKMYISGEVTVSFSDAGMRNEYHLGIFHFLKNEYPDDVTVPDPKHSYITDGRGRWGILFRVFMWFNEDYLTPDSRAEEETFYAADTGWLIYRNPKFGFAAKGGYNDEPHNHNDVGSFIIASDNRQIITDMGAGRYTRQYFAKDTRYGILQCSSRGHSVPIVGGEYQKYGAEYRAENVKCEDGVFSLEMASAYGLPELKSLKREFEWSKDAVILRDSFVYEGEGALVERFVTLYPPKEISPGRVDMHGAVLVYDPEKYTLSFSSEVRDAEGRVAYFTDLTLKDGVREFVCEFCV